MEQTARQEWLGLLAKSPDGALDQLWSAFGATPEYSELRAPEIGTVMVRGRAGATGAAFNVGEVSVTRCSVRLDCGPVGHGYVQGRSTTKARQAALVDALMQTDEAEDVKTRILAPLEKERAARKSETARKAAATKVEFFTMARGED